MAVQEEFFKKKYIPKGGGSYSIEHEEVPEPVEYSGWVLPSLAGFVSGVNWVRFMGMVIGLALCWEVTTYGVAGILDQVGGPHACSIVIGR